MPSLKTTILAVLAATATAMPATVRLTPRQMQYHSLAKRQQEGAAAAGLSDFDILQLYVLFLAHFLFLFLYLSFEILTNSPPLQRPHARKP